MSYIGGGGPGGRSEEGYQELDDETAPSSVFSRVGGGDTVDTSGDLALAMALSQEEGGGRAPGANTARDEELALALAMAMDEEYEAGMRQHRDEEPERQNVPKPQPKTHPEIAPRKQSIDPAGVAHTMFERLMSTFRRRTSSTEKREDRRARAERYKERNIRQATLLFNVMEVYVPDFLRTENFLVMKPDGTVCRIHVDPAFLHPPFFLTYDGEPLMKGSPRILDDKEQMSAFLDYYRFDPIEIETELDIIPGPRSLGGLELVSQPEGVFVKWGVFPLPPSERKKPSMYEDDFYDDEGQQEDEDEEGEMEILETQSLVVAGDLIVQVGSAPTTSLENLRSLLTSFPVGSRVAVRVLRKPPPMVRCPMGHTLRLDDPRAAVDAECDSCRSNFGRHHCVECGFSLCWPCFQVIYAHSKARFPVPVNNDHEFTEAPRTTRLTFSEADVGVKVLIYWYTTAEWWIGQIESFDPIKGHTVVYEERNGTKCAETVPDFTRREYRILTHCMLNSDVIEPFHAATLGDQGKEDLLGTATTTATLPMDLLSGIGNEFPKKQGETLLDFGVQESSKAGTIPEDLMMSSAFAQPAGVSGSAVGASWNQQSTSASYQSAKHGQAPVSLFESLGLGKSEPSEPFLVPGSQFDPANLLDTPEPLLDVTKIQTSETTPPTQPVLSSEHAEQAGEKNEEENVVVSAEEAEMLKAILGEAGGGDASAEAYDEEGPP